MDSVKREIVKPQQSDQVELRNKMKLKVKTRKIAKETGVLLQILMKLFAILAHFLMWVP